MDAMEPAAPDEPLIFDITERRVLGTLIEKSLATPDVYPLTLNALVSGCNQKSNRDPVMSLESFEIDGALQALKIKGFVTMVEREGGRTVRYGHRLGERLGLGAPELAVLAELLLRGPQTTNELKTRTARMGASLSAEAVEALLGKRAEGDRPLFRLSPRRPGERYPRWRHLLMPADEAPAEPAVAGPEGRSDAAGRPGRTDLVARLAALEARVARLETFHDSGVVGAAPEPEPKTRSQPDPSGWIDVD